LEVFFITGFGNILERFNFVRIHHHTFGGYEMSEEFYLLFIEVAFFEFECESSLSNFVKNPLKGGEVFFE